MLCGVSEATELIEVSHLTKKYGEHTAVSDLSFTIDKGHIYGLLGPNGAGKSTTMNIITGCLAATEGEIKIGGFDIFEQPKQAKALIGYLPEIPPLYVDRTPREFLRFVAEAKKVPTDEIQAQIEEACEMTGISDVSDRLIKVLSKGYRQRVGIAQALIGRPEIIILDEPTVGLDPKQIIEIRELIKKLGEDHTVILSSHILSEVQAVCDTVLIISAGRLVACDTPDNLEMLFAGEVGIELTAECSIEEAEKIISTLQLEINEISADEEGKCHLILKCAGDDRDGACRRLFFAFAKAEKPIIELSAKKAKLEDVFIELTSGEEKEAEEE